MNGKYYVKGYDCRKEKLVLSKKISNFAQKSVEELKFFE
jgi:hypothetical protein